MGVDTSYPAGRITTFIIQVIGRKCKEVKTNWEILNENAVDQQYTKSNDGIRVISSVTL